MLWGSHAELVAVPARHHVAGARRRRHRARSRACRSRSAPPTTASSSSAGCSGRDRADPGGRGRRRHRRDPAREASRRDGDRDRVERRAARAASTTSASTTASTTRSRTGSTRSAAHRRTGRRPRRRLGRRQGPRRQRRSASRTAAGAITVGSAGRDPQPFDVSAALDGQPVAHRRVPRRRDRDTDARASDDRATSSTTSRSGRLQVVVDRTYPLAEAAAAHAYLESRQAVGRVVLIP